MKPEDFHNFMSRGIAAQKAVNEILKIKEKPMSDRANYNVILQVRDFVLIKDLGPHDQYLTITNGAESVVRELVSNGKIQSGQRLFYLDSEGEMSEIEFHVIDGFQRFSALQETDAIASTCLGAWKQVKKHVK